MSKTKLKTDFDQVSGRESWWPEMAVRGRKLNGEGLLDRILVYEFRHHGSTLTEQPDEIPDVVAPVITRAFR